MPSAVSQVTAASVVSQPSYWLLALGRDQGRGMNCIVVLDGNRANRLCLRLAESSAAVTAQGSGATQTG
jgi:hypothetical protein